VKGSGRAQASWVASGGGRAWAPASVARAGAAAGYVGDGLGRLKEMK
jgi:hypothetical protein